MELNNLILIEQFCGYYNIPSNFIKSLEEIELKYSSFMPIRIQGGLLEAAVSQFL